MTDEELITRELAPHTEQTAEQILTIEDVAHFSRADVIRKLAEAVSRRVTLDPQVLMAVMSRSVSEAQVYDHVRETTPWPASDPSEKPSFAYEYHGERTEIIPPGQDRAYPGGLYDRPSLLELDAMDILSMRLFKQLPPDQRADILVWSLKLSGHVAEANIEEYFERTLRIISAERNNQVLMGPLLDYLISQKDTYTYRSTGKHFPDTHTDMIMQRFGEMYRFLNLSDSMLDHLSNCDDDTLKTGIGMIVDSVSFPAMINTVRTKLMVIPPNHPNREKIERIGRVLLNVRPDDETIPFYVRLNDLYRTIKFEEYKPNIAATEHECDLIEQYLPSSKTRGTVLDLACGTGRIANELARRGHKQIIGIDASPDNIRKAALFNQEAGGEHVDYREGNWLQTHLDRQSVQTIICIGRSLPHVESEAGLFSVVHHLSDIIKPDGQILFDFPNPDKGNYLAHRKQHLNFLKSVGIPMERAGDEQAQLSTIDTIIDGPTDQDLYNRYVPSPDHIKQIFGGFGFSVQEIRRASIGDTGDENIYYRAVKRKNGDDIAAEHIRARLRKYAQQ